MIKQNMRYLLLLFHGAKNLDNSLFMKELETQFFNSVQNLKNIHYNKLYTSFLMEGLEQSFLSVIKEIHESSNSYTIIDVFPIFLLPGKHLNEDVPALIHQAKKTYSTLSINLLDTPNFIKDMIPYYTHFLHQKTCKV